MMNILLGRDKVSQRNLPNIYKIAHIMRNVGSVKKYWS